MAGTSAALSKKQLRHLAPMILVGLAVAFPCLLFVSLCMGLWLIDPSGLPIPTDFINVWAAGKLVLQGAPADAYDWTIHKNIEVIGAGHDFAGYFGWHYPPPFLLIAAPLALLPYPIALLAWMLASLPLYLASIWQIVGRREALLAAFAWPVVFWNMVVGQNGFLTAALLAGGLAMIERRPALAGILIGLLTYKPQFGLLIPLALVASGHWRVLGWAVLSAVGLGAISALALGLDVWLAFLKSIVHTNDAILLSGLAQFAKLQSPYGQIRALGGSVQLAWLTHGALVAASAVFVWRLWARKSDFDTQAAALATTTLLASPYIYLYDLVALSVPLAFLGRTGFSNRETVTLLVIGALLLWGPDSRLATGLLAMLLVLGMIVLRALHSPARPRPADVASFEPIELHSA